ncbi:dual-specificity kinase [Babesia microti strain RI]|uniref:Dual-specificity kinase n=1 Tax=Babesia microti (strain RI) TaxID=1133968 RepID=A0A1R4A9W9_BABMR|nr:dual-specificity kinase [Babesia microti strain RI]SJK85780.1 dual-specificity kinase [Babesia microti strain RI]|eukprot:XP_021338002.1 dual-specificity kinase [Babesia microti strain RI]
MPMDPYKSSKHSNHNYRSRYNGHTRYLTHGRYNRSMGYRRRDIVRRYSPYRRRDYRQKPSRSRYRHSPYRHKYYNRHRRGGNSGDSHQTKKESDDRDQINHFKWDEGMELDGRYIVKHKMGDGTFGRVLYCQDKKTNRNVAIKVVRDVEKYASSAKIEANLLFDIKKIDPEGNSKCVVLHDIFHHGRHICLVFEVLGSSLYDFLVQNNFKGYFIRDIQEIARQTLQSLAFLRKVKIVHTDLKPENILFTCRSDEYEICRDPRSSFSRGFTKRPCSADVKIIDFGSAIYVDEYHSPLINTRQYRSPEVILDIGWSFASDVWSLGCILIELYTGKLLFGTHDHLEHLAMIESTIGRLPANVIKDASKTSGSKYLNRDCTGLNWPNGAKSSSSLRRVKDCVPVSKLVLPVHKKFADFIEYLLEMDQYKRPIPEQAMSHPFLMDYLSEN